MIDFKDKNVLVTGGNGMIGQSLVELLYDTTSANIMVADLPNVDLRDRKDCKAVCEGQDIVFHLAGIKGSPQRCMKAPASFSVPMIQFNANMVEAAYNADIEWFLYTSSVGVYHPAEMFVEDDVWGDGTPIRDFIHARDVARGMVFAVENQITEPLNLGSGNGVSIAKIASSIAACFECGIKFDSTKPSGDAKRLMDMTRTFSYGFENLTDIDDGLQETIEWYINNENR
jgi:nucleoside-diphosphate-sugar epimerase